MANRTKFFGAKLCMLAVGTLSIVGAANAGSCISSTTYEGPSNKVIVSVKNNTSTPFDAVIGKAKNTTDVREQDDTYSEKRNRTVDPGTQLEISDSQAPNGNKVYSVDLLGTLNIFRITNDAGLASGSTKYRGKAENMEYRSYNQTGSNPYKIDCQREFKGNGKWVITFNVTDR